MTTWNPLILTRVHWSKLVLPHMSYIVFFPVFLLFSPNLLKAKLLLLDIKENELRTTDENIVGLDGEDYTKTDTIKNCSTSYKFLFEINYKRQRKWNKNVFKKSKKGKKNCQKPGVWLKTKVKGPKFCCTRGRKKYELVKKPRQCKSPCWDPKDNSNQLVGMSPRLQSLTDPV